MKIPFRLIFAAVTSVLFLNFSGAVGAQAGPYVQGTAPSGETVQVIISSRPPLKYPRRAQRMGIEGFVVLSLM